VHKVWIVNSGSSSRSVFRYFGGYDPIRFNIYLIAGMVAVLDVPLIGLKTDLVYCTPAQLAQGSVELAFININVVLVAGSTNFQNEVPVRKVWGQGVGVRVAKVKGRIVRTIMIAITASKANPTVPDRS
jgi:hypothetical protein